MEIVPSTTRAYERVFFIRSFTSADGFLEVGPYSPQRKRLTKKKPREAVVIAKNTSESCSPCDRLLSRAVFLKSANMLPIVNPSHGGTGNYRVDSGLAV